MSIPSRQNQLKIAEKHYAQFMLAVGLPLDEQTISTPMRVAKMFLDEFCSHNGPPPEVALFPAKGYDQYIAVRDIRFSSLCLHHHLPMTGQVSVGYQPGEWLAGLSKIPRVVRYFSSRPQLQEYLVCDVAEYLMEQLKPHFVMVLAKAKHSCMSCRGIRDPESETVTSKILFTEESTFDKDEMLRLLT